jgi:hypothetical protein
MSNGSDGLNAPIDGGCYVRGLDGVLRKVEEPTKDHPQGNRARDADGKPVGLPSDETHFNSPAPAAAGTDEEIG